jgi:hypothetical protein
MRGDLGHALATGFVACLLFALAASALAPLFTPPSLF